MICATRRFSENFTTDANMYWEKESSVSRKIWGSKLYYGEIGGTFVLTKGQSTNSDLKKTQILSISIWVITVLVMYVFPVYAEMQWYPYPVDVWSEPFNMESPRVYAEYVPLEKSSRPWHISVFLPHMKDSYWLAVNYGVAYEAKRLGVKVDFYQAGGYDNLDVQLAQIKKAIAAGTDGVIIGAISYDGRKQYQG